MTPENQPNRALLTLDLAALRHNLANVRSRVPNAKVMAVIKADGYGHGMTTAAEALNSADEFGVSCLQDAARLRAAGVTAPITTLSGQFSKQQFEALDSKTYVTIFEHSQLAVLATCQPDAPRSIWLKVDTGMGRLGFFPAELDQVMRQLSALKWLDEIKLISHLANADQPNKKQNAEQFERLAALTAIYDFAEISMLNSGGVCAFAENANQTVRPGVMLYGASPLKDTSGESLGLKPVMTLSAPLIAIRDMPAGSQIGYGGTQVLSNKTRVGILACGYGDGYPRRCKQGSPVLIGGQTVPLLGRVSMDMVAVNLDTVDSQVGDDAVLWGRGNPIEEIAECAGTIAYELMCGVTNRVHRQIVDG